MRKTRARSWCLIACAALAAGVGLATRPRSSAPPWSLSGAGAEAGEYARLCSSNLARGLEGGNIGRIHRVDDAVYELHLRNDNDDALPPLWRQWFYTELAPLPTDRPVTLTLRNHGFDDFYVPVYSYDNVRWRSFDEGEVTQPAPNALRVVSRFRKPRVWIARYHPYTYARLRSWLGGLARHPDARVGEFGRSEEGRALPLLEIGAPARRGAARPQHVLIHARTHPGEVGSSFLLEGLVDYLLSNEALARRMRRELRFVIAPMLNVDGVVNGNNRTTPMSHNLEGQWASLAGQPLLLEADAPREVRAWHAKILELRDDGAPLSMALNLHASNGAPEDQTFFFPHFGPREAGYSDGEAGLRGKQQLLIDLWRLGMGKAWFNAPVADGGRSFIATNCPEAWWWRNFGDQVMALSIESTYGRAGPLKRWVAPADMHRLGRTLGVAIGRYHGLDGGSGQLSASR